VDDKIAQSVEFSKCGNYIAASDSAGSLYLYDAKTFALITKTEPTQVRSFAIGLDFSDKSRTKN